MSRDADLAFAHSARGRGRRDHARALPRERPRRRDEARPDAGLGGRPRRGGGDPRARRERARRRGRARRGVRRRRRRGALDRRPDRRDDELRPRHPGVGHAARARARRRRRGRRSCRRRRSAAAGGRFAAEGAWAGGERCRVSAVARIEDCVVSTTAPREMPPGWAEVVRRAWAMPRPQRLLAALPRRRGRPRRRRGSRHAAVGLRRRPPRRRGGRRPLHDIRGRRARAGRDVAEHERRPARSDRGAPDE